MLEIIFPYSQDICPFKSSFWSAILQTKREKNILTDKTLKKITQDVLVRCSVIMSDHNVELAGHSQNVVGQCPVTDCYFAHCNLVGPKGIFVI